MTAGRAASAQAVEQLPMGFMVFLKAETVATVEMAVLVAVAVVVRSQEEEQKLQALLAKAGKAALVLETVEMVMNY